MGGFPKQKIMFNVSNKKNILFYYYRIAALRKLFYHYLSSNHLNSGQNFLKGIWYDQQYYKNRISTHEF